MGGDSALMTSSSRLDSDNRFSTAIEARFFGGADLVGERRGIERRGAGAGVALVDLRAFAPDLTVPPFRKAAMSCVASSSELILATQKTIVRRVSGGSGKLQQLYALMGGIRLLRVAAPSIWFDTVRVVI